MPQQILSLQLGACLSMPTRRAYKLLSELARDCNRIRNAVATDWLLARRADPEWTPGPRRDRKGAIKKDKNGKVLLEHPIGSQKLVSELFHVYKKVAPHVSSNVASHCWTGVIQWLKGRVPWNSETECKFRWEAILASEIAIPNHTGCAIPVPNKNTVLGYRGELSRCVSSPVLKRMARDSCIISIPIWNRESGRKQRDLIFRLQLRQMTKGHRTLVAQVAARELRLADSKLIGKDGKWFFQLTYERPTKEKRDAGVVAILRPCSPDAANPFVLELGQRKRYLGDGRTYEFALRRIGIRRRTIQARYREGTASGRGRKRFMRAYKQHSRAVMDMQRTVQKRMVATIVRWCEKYDVGRIVYREPTMPLRDKSWFSRRDLPWGWAEMLQQLKHKLQPETVLVVERMPLKEFLELRDAVMDKPKREVIRYARLQCDNCQADVYIPVDEYVKRNGEPTYCEQCGRYVTRGTARSAEKPKESEVGTRQVRKRAYRPRRNQQPLAKHRVTRTLPRAKEAVGSASKRTDK